MYGIRGSWAGQAFALATSNDSGGKKSRNRLSKEERKAMVESFIKKYQKSNNGEFPSLSLTNKEVGGSFYKVREIVREIIQENRVLAPPKVSDEHGNSEFLEGQPLESISMEPQIDLHVSDRAHIVTHIAPPKDYISSEGNISSCNEQLNGSFLSNLESEQTGVSEVVDKDEASDNTSETYETPNHSLINNDKKFVNGFEVIEEHVRSDKPVVEDVETQDNSDSVKLLKNVESQDEASDNTSETHEAPNLSLISNDEKIVNGFEVIEEHVHSDKSVVESVESQDNSDNVESLKNVESQDEASDKTSKTHEAPNHSLISNDEKIVNGFEVIEEYVHSDKSVVKNVEYQDNSNNALLSSQEINGPGSQRLISEHYNKNDETVDNNKEFAVRTYTKSAVTEILDKEKHEAQDVEASQTVKPRLNSNVVVETFPLRPVPKNVLNMDGESGDIQEAEKTLETIQSSTGFVQAKDEKRVADEKVVLNLEGSSLEGSKYSSASKPVVLDEHDVADVESEDIVADGTPKVSVVETKASDQESRSFSKGNNPTLDRINLGTWEGTSKKSTGPETNPLLTFVKAFISSFVKFWTE